MIIGATALARELGISRITVYMYIKDGMPHYRKSEKKLVFEIEEVKEWLKNNYKKI